MSYQDKTFTGTETLDNRVGVEIVAGSFALSGATTAATIVGQNFSVTSVSSGTYTIKLTKVYSNVISAIATFQGDTATDRHCSVGNIDLATTLTIKLRSYDKVSGVANIATDGTERVNFLFVLAK